MAEFEQLDVDIIKADLNTGGIGSEVLVFKSTSSTNDVAWDYANNQSNHGLCVFAEHQSSGRGRMGTDWQSESGDSVLCSVLIFDGGLSADLLTLSSAVATAEAISDLSGKPAKIKWPNDVMIDEKKVAGILLESRTIDDKAAYVIGIGINCHQDKRFFQGVELQMPATSIDIHSGRRVDRNKLAGKLLTSLQIQFEQARNDPDKIIDRWRQLSSLLGHHITVQYNQRQFKGNCIGLDPARGLILQLEAGGIRMFDAAHTRIVKQ